jgi:hypoxanthine-guanine phosphoribosyltransferase
VRGPNGHHVDGAVELGSAERSWRLAPSELWCTGRHELVIDDILEDVAGNSVRRVFDRDQTRSSDAVREKGPFVIGYFPR